MKSKDLIDAFGAVDDKFWESAHDTYAQKPLEIRAEKRSGGAVKFILASAACIAAACVTVVFALKLSGNNIDAQPSDPDLENPQAGYSALGTPPVSDGGSSALTAPPASESSGVSDTPPVSGDSTGISDKSSVSESGEDKSDIESSTTTKEESGEEPDVSCNDDAYDFLNEIMTICDEGADTVEEFKSRLMEADKNGVINDISVYASGYDMENGDPISDGALKPGMAVRVTYGESSWMEGTIMAGDYWGGLWDITKTSQTVDEIKRRLVEYDSKFSYVMVYAEDYSEVYEGELRDGMTVICFGDNDETLYQETLERDYTDAEG